MTSVSNIGIGNMGTAIASVAVKGGHTSQRLGQGDGDTAVEGDVVILAVPHVALTDIVAERGASLAGKVVVDIINPVDFDTMDGLVVDSNTSAATALADALPDSKVVKAFNASFAGTRSGGTVGPLTTTVLVAGDGVTAGGLNAAALRRARELEALGFLQIPLAARRADLLRRRLRYPELTTAPKTQPLREVVP